MSTVKRTAQFENTQDVCTPNETYIYICSNIYVQQYVEEQTSTTQFEVCCDHESISGSPFARNTQCWTGGKLQQDLRKVHSSSNHGHQTTVFWMVGLPSEHCLPCRCESNTLVLHIWPKRKRTKNLFTHSYQAQVGSVRRYAATSASVRVLPVETGVARPPTSTTAQHKHISLAIYSESVCSCESHLLCGNRGW